jgi:hypothetical protein
MATNVLGFDSDFDKTTSLVSNWRRSHVYKKFESDGHQVSILKENMATRMYLEAALVKNEVTYFTASGHGHFDEFQGTDGSHSLGVGRYIAEEVKGKIIHLLSCHTAFQLGVDVVTNGCTSFFGYDNPFTYLEPFLDYFMAPDAELDYALSQGKTAEQALKRAIEVYQQKINELKSKGEFHAAAIMEYNLEHLCSHGKDARWGSGSVKI